MMGRRAGESGQGATEYMLVIAVVVVAVVAAAYTFVPQFQAGIDSLAADVNDTLDTGEVGALGGLNRQGGTFVAGENTVTAESNMPPGGPGFDGTMGNGYRPTPRIPSDGTRVANSGPRVSVPGIDTAKAVR